MDKTSPFLIPTLSDGTDPSTFCIYLLGFTLRLIGFGYGEFEKERKKKLWVLSRYRCPGEKKGTDQHFTTNNKDGWIL